MNLYKELQQLKTKQPEAHALDAPTPNTTENYMISEFLTNLEANSGVAMKGTTLRASMHIDSNQEVDLLDSTTHTILRDALFFSFIGDQTDAWQICKMQTIAGGRDFKFREGRAMIVLPGGATLQINNAMYAPAASRSLISFKDLRANGIHTTTVVKNNREALELQRETKVLAIAYARCGGLYELPIGSGGQPHQVSLASDLTQPQTENSRKLADPLFLPMKIGLWHSRMGHP